MSEHSTAVMRKELKLHGLGQIVPVFLVTEDGSGLEPGFECVPCGELLVWTSGENMWLCPCCTYQLALGHGADLLEFAKVAADRAIDGMRPGSAARVAEPTTKTGLKEGLRKWLGTFR